MGRMKERHIELMSQGVSNLYKVALVYGYGIDEDEYEHTNLKEALEHIALVKENQSVDVTSLYLVALNLRTLRERLVKKTGNEWRIYYTLSDGRRFSKFKKWGGSGNVKNY